MLACMYVCACVHVSRVGIRTLLRKVNEGDEDECRLYTIQTLDPSGNEVKVCSNHTRHSVHEALAQCYTQIECAPFLHSQADL